MGDLSLERAGAAAKPDLAAVSQPPASCADRCDEGRPTARADFNPDDITPDGRPPAQARLFDPAIAGVWRGRVEGETIGGAMTVLAYGTDVIGAGPRLHVHPYDETFVVIEGRARFFVGAEVLEAAAGEVVLGPAGLPHRFENLGPGSLQTIDLHHSPIFIQADID